MTYKKSGTGVREPPGSRDGSLYLSKDIKGAAERKRWKWPCDWD